MHKPFCVMKHTETAEPPAWGSRSHRDATKLGYKSAKWIHTIEIPNEKAGEYGKIKINWFAAYEPMVIKEGLLLLFLFLMVLNGCRGRDRKWYTVLKTHTSRAPRNAQKFVWHETR